MQTARRPLWLERLKRAEWPTFGLLALCYGLWALGTTAVAEWFLPAGIALTVVATALHSSLTHEMCHGHPFRSRFWNAVLVFPALSLTVPYLRFKDTHLAHHRDSRLTDPYDDPNRTTSTRWSGRASRAGGRQCCGSTTPCWGG